MKTHIHFLRENLNFDSLKHNYPDDFNNLDPVVDKILTCKVELGPVKILVEAIRNHIFIKPATSNSPYLSFNWSLHLEREETAPFVSIEAVGNACHKNTTIEVRKGYNWNSKSETITVLDKYNLKRKKANNYYSYSDEMDYNTGTPWNYVSLKVTANDGYSAEGELKFEYPEAGTVDKITGRLIQTSLNFFGLQLTKNVYLNEPEKDSHGYYSRDDIWCKVLNLFTNYTVPDKDSLWTALFDAYEASPDTTDTKAIKALETSKKIKPNLDRLAAEEPIVYRFYLWLHDSRTKDGITNNQCLSAFLKKSGENYDELRNQLKNVMVQAETIKYDPFYIGKDYENPLVNRNICMLFDAAKERDEDQRSHKEWYLKKTTLEQAEVIGVNNDRYPLLYAAIGEQNIPLGVFHNPGDKLKYINVEFEIWEKALARDGWAEVIYKISQNASKRNTYERDITPYLSFLFKIEKYLDKHSPGKTGWKAMPSYVNSEWQLEMDEATEEGTVKKRSALTPVADNDARTINVPYASIAISGRQTTYCYSKHYFVFEENMIDDESGSVVIHDLEIKLNGRDDYGLMYYTLTGTDRNRGYPTFLIIFERLSAKTRVHFHRVHPNRYKDGRPTPACRLIEECYRYMASTRAEEIYAQQGDLIIIKSEERKNHSVEELKKIKDFESHSFTSEATVFLLENSSKSIKNRLGFIWCQSNFSIIHPEHESITNIPAGWYEIRRCRSWEANPRAVWSYTID